jgi:hypothetical protein
MASLPSDRSNPAGAFPAYVAAAGTHPAPTPVYHVVQPTKAARYPSARNNAQAAIPISIKAGPGGGAVPVIVAAAPNVGNAGAIPVWP